ncbi:MAG: hypothetical protein ABL993_14820 [Vicinamibacterales bacterium]
MRIQWMLAGLLAMFVVAGCRDRAKETAPNASPTPPMAEAPAGGVPAAEPAPSVEESAAAPEKSSVPAAPRAESSGQATPSRPRVPVGKPVPVAPMPEPPVPAVSTPAAEATPAPLPPEPKPEWKELTIAVGTVLPLVLGSELSSESDHVETPVRARLRDAVLVDGEVALPKGAMLVGTVTEVRRSGRVEGRARLAFTFDRVEIQGTPHSLRTHPIQYEAESSKSDDAAKIGVGAIGGAIVGGILGGAKGAATGAAVGGAAGTGAVLVTRGKEVRLLSGTDVVATLAAPLVVMVPFR